MWRAGATTEELREIASIDKRLAKLHSEAQQLSRERSTITQRCDQRALRRRRAERSSKT